ncbi:uncharacterized protein LOC141912468 [Tubulanus polymorphus]|uniref:uncharacterized protein LOC141912468 n=1 Tax=Tubulanus polymorphus TaxID=672921 RepID=UPI003DA28D40
MKAMPSGQYGLYVDDDRDLTAAYDNPALDVSSVNGAAANTSVNSAASILRSVHEQEAQFEQLTRELEQERRSVANQLERCKLGSETASLSSISSTDDSFRWRAGESGQYTSTTQESSHVEDDSDADSKSGSNLVDSCLRVLQERGVMNIGDDPLEQIPEDILRSHNRPPPGLDNYRGQIPSPHSPQLSTHSNESQRMMRREERKTVTTVTTVSNRDSPVHGSYSREYSFQSTTDSPNGQRSHSPNAGYYGYPSEAVPGSASDRFEYFDPAGGTSLPAVQHQYFESDFDPRDYAPQRPTSISQYSDRPPSSLNQYSDRPTSLSQQYADRPSSTTQNNYSLQQPDDYPYHPRNSYQDYPDDYRNSPVDTGRLRGGNYDDYPDRYPDDQTYRKYPEDDGGQFAPARPRHDDSYSNPPNDNDFNYRHPLPDQHNHSFSHEPPYAVVNKSKPPALNNYSSDYPDYQPDHSDGLRNIPVRDDRYGGVQRSPSPIGSERYGNGPQGYGPQGYNDVPRGYDDAPQGYGDGPRGYDDAPRGYDDAPRGYDDAPRGYNDAPRGYDNGPHGYDDDDDPRYDPRLTYPDDIPREDAMNVNAPPPVPRSPSIDSETKERLWRDPSLVEVIEFLSHPSNNIKANAAAYLQHLVFNNNDVKAKTRGLGGIPPLVELLDNEIPEVHKSACGALRNLSYGRENDDNKRAIKNADGIPALVRLLRKSPDSDVRELVTANLWNLSSCKDLKKPIIDDALTVIVNNVIIPHSGWSPDGSTLRQDMQWSTVFRNASGTLRNVSSDGDYARKKLRECEGLPDSLMLIIQQAIGKNDIDNKSVENIVCILRNLCYGCQEVADPDYFRKRQPQQKTQQPKEGKSGCFGGSKKKKEKDPATIDHRNRSDSGYQSGRQFDPNRPRTEPIKGMELLWQPNVVYIYLPLLSDCSNPETLEAAAGAIQNLSAGDWTPSVDIRAAVRKEKGLPIIVELLTIEADRVVCAAATALRNLAIDERNKELIGKYAMRQLVSKLPIGQVEYPPSDDTIAAVLATLYEVVRKNPDFCQSLLEENGVQKLVNITRSRNKFNAKVVKFASTVLFAMWQFKALHPEYKRRGFKEQHFITKTMAPKNAQGKQLDGNSTLFRPKQTQGGGSNDYNTKTMQPIQRNKQDQQSSFPSNYSTLPPEYNNHVGTTTVPTIRPEDQYNADPYSRRNPQYDAGRDEVDRGGNYNLGPGDHYDPRLNESFGRDDPYGHTTTNERHSILMDDRFDPRAQPYARDNGAYEGHDDRYRNEQQRYDPYNDRLGEDIQMNDMRPYATFEETRQQALDEGYRPPGGVSVYPNHAPASYPQSNPNEPLYARVNKSKRNPDRMILANGPEDGGADSWV